MESLPTLLVKISLTLALFLLQCSVIGLALSGWLKLWQNADAQKNNAYLKWFFAISMGLMVNIAALFLLGMAAWLNRSAVLGTGLLLALLALPRLLALIREDRAFSHLRFGIAPLLELLVLLAMFLTIALSALKAPGHWDDTMYHLPLARHYLQHEAIILHEFVRFPLFPQNIDLLLMLGLMLGNVVTAQAFVTLPLFIMGIGLIGTGKWLLGSILPGVLATLVMIMLPVVTETLGYAYIDSGLALFCWGATLAFAKWNAQEYGRPLYAWVIIAGVLAGGAAGSKYFGGVFAVLLGFLLLVRCREWKVCAIYALTVLLSGGWWYVRSVIISGDPIHPAGGNIFGHFLWNAADLLSQKQEQAIHGVPHNPLNLWSALSKARVEVWILAFASLLFYRKTPGPVRTFQFVFLAYFVLWFFGFQVERYLAPIYAVGSFLSIYFLYRLFFPAPVVRWLSSRLGLWGNALAGLLSLLLFTLSAADHYRSADEEMASWKSNLERRPGFILFSQANKLIPTFGPRLMQFGFDNAVFFFDGVVIGDWFGPARYQEMVSYEGDKKRLIAPQAMKHFMEQFNSRMLAVKSEQLTFDAPAYREYFDVVAQTKDGLLFVAK